MFYLIPVPSDKSIDDNQAFYVFALGLINLIRSTDYEIPKRLLQELNNKCKHGVFNSKIISAIEQHDKKFYHDINNAENGDNLVDNFNTYIKKFVSQDINTLILQAATVERMYMLASILGVILKNLHPEVHEQPTYFNAIISDLAYLYNVNLNLAIGDKCVHSYKFSSKPAIMHLAFNNRGYHVLMPIDNYLAKAIVKKFNIDDTFNIANLPLYNASAYNYWTNAKQLLWNHKGKLLLFGAASASIGLVNYACDDSGPAADESASELYELACTVVAEYKRMVLK